MRWGIQFLAVLAAAPLAAQQPQQPVQLEVTLNEATQRAYDAVGRPEGARRA